MNLEVLIVDRNIVCSLKQRRSDRSPDAFTFYQTKHGETRLDLLDFLSRSSDEENPLYPKNAARQTVNGVSVTLVIWRLFS